MKPRILLLAFLFSIVTQTITAQSANVPVDTFWGIPVADPYRWLEDLNSDTIQTWLKKQRKATWAERQKLSYTYRTIESKFRNEGFVLYHNDKYIKKGPYYFQFQQRSNLSSPALYYKKRINGDTWLAYSTNDFGKEPVSIEDYEVSKNGKYLAVELSKGGSDWHTIRVRDMKKQKTLPDKIDWIKFSNIVWVDSGFFYSRFKEPSADLVHLAPNTQQQLCFHKVGTSQQQDAIVYSIPDQANSIFGFEKIETYLILYSVAKLNGKWCNIIAYKDLRNGIYAPEELLLSSHIEKEIDFSVVAIREERFLIATNLDAPRYKILSCHKDSINRLEEFIPQFNQTMQSMQSISHNRLLGLYLKDGAYTVAVFDSVGNVMQHIQYPVGEKM